MTRRKAIIVDLDGTLCDSRHPLHHIVNPEGRVDWPAWDSGAHLDTPNQWCVALVEAMKARDVSILFVTGRGERLREDSAAWLSANLSCLLDYNNRLLNGGYYNPYEFMLLMRPDEDHRPDTVVKAELYKQYIEPHYDVLFAIDDKASVVDMWRSLGIACLECDRWTAEMEAAANHYLKPESERKK